MAHAPCRRWPGGCCPRARLVRHRRGIGTCPGGSCNVDARWAPAVRGRSREGWMAPRIFVGVDIGKASHYAVGVDADGETDHQRVVGNDEADLGRLVAWAAEHDAVLIVDQPGGTAALLLRLCWAVGVAVGYLHGTAMARARDFYAGEGKSDPEDALVLAD